MSNAIEAIVLSVMPFQDSHQIATLYTADLGLCKAIGSYSRSPKNALFGCLSPLNHIEVIFRPSKSELLKIESAAILNPYREMRRDYDLLKLGCESLNCIAKSQHPHKASPILFILLKNYLSLLIDAKSPKAILSSLQLKILRHEGVLAVTNQCPICGNEPEEICIEGGQVVCSTHGEGILFSAEETSYFYALALSSSVKFLKDLEIPESLSAKVLILFDQLI